MSDLSFPLQPLSDVALAIKDGTHATHPRVTSGVPLLSAKNITSDGAIAWDDTDDLISEVEYRALDHSFHLEPEDLLLTVVGSLGRRAVYQGERVAFQRSVAYVRPHPRRIVSRFLFHWMGHPAFAAELRRRSNATAQAGLYLGELAKVSAPVPEQREQVQIAQILDTLETAIHETEALIAKLKAVKQGLLHDLLTRGIDANGELRPCQDEAPHLYKQSLLGWIPKEWSVKTGREVCTEIVVGIVVRPTQYYRSEGIPVLRSANVRENRLTLTDLVFMSERDHRSLAKSAVRPGDVLTVRTGYPGTSCVVSSGVSEANCVDILISRPSRELDAGFWSRWINSDWGKTQVLAAQGGLAQQHFNVADLQQLLVFMPALTEQIEITRRLDSADARIHDENLTLNGLTELRAGLVDDLLTGRVRVTPLLAAEEQGST